MVKKSKYGILFFLLLCFQPLHAQLNEPEKIFINSLSSNIHFGFQLNDTYYFIGDEGSCRTATIWLMDEEFNLIRKKHLIHKYYEVSSIVTTSVTNSSIRIMTHQWEADDVGDQGIKYYSLSPALDILDSLYMPSRYIEDALIRDSTWIFRTANSLQRISALDGSIIQNISLDNDGNDLVDLDSIIYTWKDSLIFAIDSSFGIDTFYLQHKILDIERGHYGLFVLTDSFILQIKDLNNFDIHDSIEAPKRTEKLVYHPYLPALVAVTTDNSVHYYSDSLTDNGTVQLFHDPIYKEDLKYNALKDGSILRFGKTSVAANPFEDPLYGQEFGFIQRFDEMYSDKQAQRSNLTMDNLALVDKYYGLKPKYILGDSVYITTQDSDSKLQWTLTNSGQDTIRTGMVATNYLDGFNCAEYFNTQFMDTILPPGETIKRGFTVYENPYYPDGYKTKRLLFAAFPNGHYDADFSDNLYRFSFKHIMTSSESELYLEDIKIYPNPSSGDLNIQSDLHFPIQRMDLIDSRGQMVWSRKMLPDGKQSIALNVPGGIYFIRLYSPTKVVIRKVSVIR